MTDLDAWSGWKIPVAYSGISQDISLSCPFQYPSWITIFSHHVETNGAANVRKDEVDRPVIVTDSRACGACRVHHHSDQAN